MKPGTSDIMSDEDDGFSDVEYPIDAGGFGDDDDEFGFDEAQFYSRQTTVLATGDEDSPAAQKKGSTNAPRGATKVEEISDHSDSSLTTPSKNELPSPAMTRQPFKMPQMADTGAGIDPMSPTPEDYGLQSGQNGTAPDGMPNFDDAGLNSPDKGAHTSATLPQLYDPTDFADPALSEDVQTLFSYITRYQPVHMSLETNMMSFIPDYIPAVGEIDNFVKIPRPDGEPDHLGLTVLDEPASQQSDPTALDLQLRAATKQAKLQPMTIRSIEGADKYPNKVTAWINNIEKVHRSKPPPHLQYTRPMPDIDQIMEVWPSEMEELLRSRPELVPGASLDVSVADYVRICCSILDIPVYDNIVHSLHLMLSAYHALQESNNNR